MTTLAAAIVLILLLRGIGFSEPMTALLAAMCALLFAGLSPEKAVLLAAGTAPRMFDYFSLMIPLIAISAGLIGGIGKDVERPRRPFGWSAAGDVRFFLTSLAFTVLIANQFQQSAGYFLLNTLLYVILLFAVALAAFGAIAGRQALSLKRILWPLAVPFVLVLPTAIPILFGLFTPTEAVCVLLLPMSFLLRFGFDLANERKFSGILDDAILAATDGAWILLAFFGGTLIVYAARLGGPLATVDWLGSLAPVYFFAIYAAATILCCSLMGATLGLLVAYAFFFPPFREAGFGLQSETAALIALLCVLTSLARPELGWKLVRNRASATISRGQFAAFAAASIFVLAVAFAVAPARF